MEIDDMLENSRVFALTTGLMGKMVEAAVKTIELDGYVARIIKKDGVEFMRTMDVNEKRINLIVSDEKVVGAEIG